MMLCSSRSVGVLAIMVLLLATCGQTKTSLHATSNPSAPSPVKSCVSPFPSLSPAFASTVVPTGFGEGVIAYTTLENGNWQIYIINADGTNVVRVTNNVKGGYEPTWSPDGAQIVFQYGGFWIANIMTGKIIQIPIEAAGSPLPNEYIVKPSWSPNGQWIAFLNESGMQGDIYLIRPDGTNLTRLTHTDDISRDGNLVWSPDSTQMAFSINGDGKTEVFLLDTNSAIQGNPVFHRVTESQIPVRNYVTSWSPDGSHIAFSSNRDGNMEIYSMDPDGGQVVRLTNNPASDTQPAWSPDGKQIAFTSDRSGAVEIYVMDIASDVDGVYDSNVYQLTHNSEEDAGPVWKPAIRTQ